MGCAVGFCEAEDATGMILGGEPVEPLMNVVAFDEAVSCEVASAGAVSASIGKQNAEAMAEEELCVAGHADAIVGEAMEEDDGFAVGIVRMDVPGAEDDAVGRGDGNVFKFGIEGMGDLTHGYGCVWR